MDGMINASSRLALAGSIFPFYFKAACVMQA
jgi:hypothetical protein